MENTKPRLPRGGFALVPTIGPGISSSSAFNVTFVIQIAHDLPDSRLPVIAMDSTQDRDQKLQFLKLILSKSEICAATLNSSLRQFFAFSLVFFILSRFYTSEMNLFGVKLQIPQAWITCIAPLVLSFYYLRIVSLYDTLTNYQGEIVAIAPEALCGEKWKISSKQAVKIYESLFWFKNFDLIELSKGKVSYWIINFTILVVTAVVIFLVPLPIIGYFMWVLWKSQGTLISVAVTCASSVFVFSSLVMVLAVSREELFE